MNTKHHLSFLFALIISGLVSGAGFSWLFSHKQVFAQDKTSAVVSAQEFRLVDANGKLRAILSENPTLGLGMSSLVFYDSNQKARLVVGTFRPDGNPNIRLMDENELPAFSLTRHEGTTTLQINRIFVGPRGGGFEWSSLPALTLKQNNNQGSNIEIHDKEMKLLWSARK